MDYDLVFFSAIVLARAVIWRLILMLGTVSSPHGAVRSFLFALTSRKEDSNPVLCVQPVMYGIYHSCMVYIIHVWYISFMYVPSL